MGRKFFNIFTVLLFSLLPFPAVHGAEVLEKFPINGGTTSDGIKVTQPELNEFTKSRGANGFIAFTIKKSASVKFNVKVPVGKEASLNFMNSFKAKNGNQQTSGVIFVVKCDGKTVYSNDNAWDTKGYEADITISEGHHEIDMEANSTINGSTFITGFISNMSLHVHCYSDTTLLKEPICGDVGLETIKCSICKKQNSIEVPAPYQDHSLKQIVLNHFSCMSYSSNITICEQCPYKDIKRSYKEQTSHDFAANGVCNSCHMSIPKCNADSTVYEVYNAGEMRILSELVSLGKIPGNIGIDIKSDLVFQGDTIMLPLGTSDNPFRGVLNGNGHRIRGIVNTYQGGDCMGFIGIAKGSLLSHAVIANLIIDKENHLQGLACVGGIVGYASNCDIINCANFGTIEGTDNVGGIVGYADQNVSIINCASVVTIKSPNKWNPIACGMPYGHIMNSYGDVVNTDNGTVTELPITMMRHCFSTQSSSLGLKMVSRDLLSSYEMVGLLNEESESPRFTKSENDPYPIPVANTDIHATVNHAFAIQRPQIPRRAASATGDDDDIITEKDIETLVFNGFVDSDAADKFGHTINEIMHTDSIEYADYYRLYVATRTVSPGFKLYEQVNGGQLLNFVSYIIPADSTSIRMKDFDIVSSDRVRPTIETIDDLSGANEQIDQYDIRDNVYVHKSRISFQNEYDMIYQENINGILKPVWSIETEYDNDSQEVVTNFYSFNYRTGEITLNYSVKYDIDNELADENYEEYFDSATNTIHAIYNQLDSVSGNVISREHYILRASDNYLIEIRTENMTDGTPTLTDGSYFVYDNEGYLMQTVYFVPDDNGSNISPFMYDEYVGAWQPTPFPTAIQVPTVGKVSPQQRIDPNIYDMQGRVVCRVTNLKDPFNGLSRGIYVYHGKKYIKR